jgi:hypothetical protein
MQSTVAMPSKRTAKANIRKTFHAATEGERSRGLSWYLDAHRFAQKVAKANNLPLEQVVGVIAVTSPQLRWEDNMAFAARLCAGEKKRITGLLFRSQVNAGRILAGTPIEKVTGGRKSKAFYDNILDPEGSKSVTIDRHAVQLAVGKKLSSDTVAKMVATAKRYESFAQAYREVAQELNLLPSALQAITWTHWTVTQARSVSKTIRQLRGMLQEEEEGIFV